LRLATTFDPINPAPPVTSNIDTLKTSLRIDQGPLPIVDTAPLPQTCLPGNSQKLGRIPLMVNVS